MGDMDRRLPEDRVKVTRADEEDVVHGGLSAKDRESVLTAYSERLSLGMFMLVWFPCKINAGYGHRVVKWTSSPAARRYSCLRTGGKVNLIDVGATYQSINPTDVKHDMTEARHHNMF
jgi:hypothetical protein